MPLLLPVSKAGHGAGVKPGVIERFGKLGGLPVEGLVVARLFDPNTPNDDGCAIAIAPDHVSDIFYNQVLERFVANVLPAGGLLPNHQTQFVACIKEGLRLWIV